MRNHVDLDRRVLIFTPVGRDGPTVAQFVARAGLPSDVCGSLAELESEIAAGAGVVVLAEEGLFGKDIAGLAHAVADQPPWSDLPFVVLTSRQDHPAVDAWRTRLMSDLRNVSLLERPAQTITLTSTVQAAFRARSRQYEVRSLLDVQAKAARDLEAQVDARTAELGAANEALLAQMAERARMEDVLRQAQKIEAIGRLTGGVAHDFNNLLMVIGGGLEMLERQTDSARRRRLLDGMRQAADRGSTLVRQLLTFSRRTELKPEPVDLAFQIGQMRDLLDRSLRGDVHVTLNLAQTLWPVVVDPGELELALLNLAVNARDAMPNGGTIEIRAENAPGYGRGGLQGDFVRLSVIDAGVGMSDEVKGHLFEPYYTTKDVGRGSGLGLAQVHGFVSQSGGTIEIDSQVGIGTSVALLLPRSREAAANRGPLTHAGETEKPSHLGCVLLVEDDDEVAALVREMLEQLGYEVTRASSAAAALGALSNDREVDLVFSDIMMPGGMSGLDLVQELRRRRSHVPVLLTSAYADAAAGRAAAEDVSVLPKPYRLQELAAAVSTAMSAK